MSATVTEFLESFPISLHHWEPSYRGKLWVFWSQFEASLADRSTRMIYEKIKSAFSDSIADMGLICQFWAPVTIEGRRLLSTSGQPFAVRDLSDHLATYRINSAKYQYIIDGNNLDIEPDPMIISGGPATAFLNRMPYIDELVRIPLDPSSVIYRSCISIMLPVCSPNRSCVGVVECTISEYGPYNFCSSLFNMNKALKNAGLNMLNVQELIPYRTINGLKPVRDEIAKALEIVCGLHNLTLAQVWIAYENKSNVPFSSSLDGAPPTQMLALKLTGYLNSESSKPGRVEKYYSLCDIVPQETEELALKTLKDYESRYISKLCPGRLMYDKPVGFGLDDTGSSALAICLRSIDTGDFDYVFEFIWLEHSNNAILLEALLLTLKSFLPSFKFAYGAQLGDKLDIIDVESSTDVETFYTKIFQEKKPMVMDGITSSDVKSRTTPILLPQEVIEKQYGKTMKEAANNLNDPESTMKRKFKDLGIPDRPGPKLMNGKVNNSSVIQTDTNEEDSGAFQEPSTVNINKNTLIIKVEHVEDMIRFHLPVLQATFATLENEIGIKFNLTLGSYKLKYLDEDGDWISLTSDEEMSDCIKSSRKSNQIIVRLCVVLFTHPISGPSDSYRICST